MTTTTPLPSSYLPPLPANALLYQRAVLNPIGVTAATSTNIGYLSKNLSQLEVVGQLTSQNPTDIYNFTFQKGTSVNAHITNIDGTAPAHFQLYDISGTRLLADNQSKGATLDAFNQLTSKDGLNLKTGQYVIKITYGKGGTKTAKQNYAFQLDSGTTFKNDYRTLASPATIKGTLLSGGSLGFSATLLTASLLANAAGGTNIDIFSAISAGSSKTSILA